MSESRPEPHAWLLGHEQGQRRRASQALMVLGVYAAYAMVQQVEVWLGLMDGADSLPVIAFFIGGGLAFYAVIRLDWNLRLARDRALTVPQAVWAMTAAVWSYAVTGPARGAILLVLMNVIVFCIFALRPQRVRQLCLAAFGMLLGVMAWKSLGSSTPYDPRVEGVHLAFAALTIASVSLLSDRIGRMRERLESQRAELAQALQRIQALATCDELTGLTNRRAAMERMQQELAVRKRMEPLMSVALIDLDHFKRINDTHGHAAGDAVLRRFADCARATVRVGDTMARWGGEEFLLVMPATSAADAMRAMERLREQLRQQRFDDIAAGLQLSFSAGVAECLGPGDLEAAIERADHAMYQAKHGGRDRAVAAPGRSPAQVVAA